MRKYKEQENRATSKPLIEKGNLNGPTTRYLRLTRT